MTASNLLLWFIILSLATWRTSLLFSRDDGPFDLFLYLRSYLYTQTLNADHSFVSDVWITLYKGIHCIGCNSVWFGAIYAIALSRSFAEWIFLTLALSATTILIHSLYEKWYNS